MCAMNKFYYRSAFFVILTLLIFTQYNTVSAQAEYQVKKTFDTYRTNKIISGEFKGGLSIDDIYGNPYLEKDFIKGTIFTVQKIQYVDIPVRYNMYSDVFEFKSDDGVFEIGVPADLEKIEFNRMIFNYIPYLDDKKLKNGFFRVIESGNATLYARHKVIFKKMEPASLTQTSKPDRFEELPIEYYMRIKNNEAISFNNKKELIGLFPDNQDKVEDFISKNKIKPNKPESLVELIKYYNSL
jgi:hypothetical protein